MVLQNRDNPCRQNVKTTILQVCVLKQVQKLFVLSYIMSHAIGPYTHSIVLLCCGDDLFFFMPYLMLPHPNAARACSVLSVHPSLCT